MDFEVTPSGSELLNAIVERSRLHDQAAFQLRFLHEVMKEIHETTVDADDPIAALQLVRIKTQVALRSVAQSGLLS